MDLTLADWEEGTNRVIIIATALTNALVVFGMPPGTAAMQG